MTGVVVVGSMNVDLVVAATRLPQPGETVLGSDIQYRAGGKGANQAVVARRLGAEVSFFGALGSDAFGVDLSTNLNEENISTDDIVTIRECPSGAALITVQLDGENTVTVAPGANSGLTPEHLGKLPKRLSKGDILLLQMEIPLATNIAAATMARHVGVTVILNAAPLPNPTTPQLAKLLALTDVLIVNKTEAGQLSTNGPPYLWEEQASHLRRWGPEVAIITLGKDGAVAAYPDSVHAEDAFDAATIDGTGAGDAFCGALAVALGGGKGIPSAVRWACAAGAIATTRVGARTGAPQFDEVEQRVTGRNGAFHDAT